MEKKKFFSAKNIAYFAVLLALVVVLQCCGGFIKIGGTSLSFVLVPIVLGGILLGPLAGGLLGFIFGFIVLMYGVSGADPFTGYLLTNSPVMTVLICLVKGVLAGIIPALIYKLIAKKNTLIAVVVAALLTPIINTGIFILGCLIISGTVTGWMEYAVSNGWMEATVAVPYYLFVGCAGVNFIVEFAINVVLAPAIHRVVIVVEKQIGKKKKAVALLDQNEEEKAAENPQPEQAEQEKKS